MGKCFFDTKVKIGGYVLVHHWWVPGNPHTKVESPWLGPFLLTSVDGRTVVVKMGTAAMLVDLSKIKVWPYSPDFSSDEPQVRYLKWIRGKLGSNTTTSWRTLRTIKCKAESGPSR